MIGTKASPLASIHYTVDAGLYWDDKSGWAFLDKTGLPGIEQGIGGFDKIVVIKYELFRYEQLIGHPE